MKAHGFKGQKDLIIFRQFQTNTATVEGGKSSFWIRGRGAIQKRKVKSNKSLVNGEALDQRQL